MKKESLFNITPNIESDIIKAAYGEANPIVYIKVKRLTKKHPEVKKAQFDELIQGDEAAATILLENLGRIIAIYDSTPTQDADEEVKEEGTRTKKKGTKKKTARSI